MSSAGLFPLHKEVFNLVEVLETARLPRAIERFIDEKTAVIGGPHISGWRSSQTTAKALCFVAQFTLSDLVRGGHIELLAAALSSYKIFYNPTLKMGAPRISGLCGIGSPIWNSGQLGIELPAHLYPSCSETSAGVSGNARFSLRCPNLYLRAGHSPNEATRWTSFWARLSQ